MDLDWNKLKIFFHVYQTQSPTKAAKILHLTQSGVSQHIKSLEENLGVELFTRFQKSLTPNHVAHELYQNTYGFYQKLNDFTKVLKDTSSDVEGSIYIGTPSGFCIKILSHLLSLFSQKYHKLSFHLEIGEANLIEPILIDGTLDFAFTDDYKSNPKIELRPIFREKIVLAGSVEKIMELNNSQDLYSHLCDQRYIVYRPDASFIRSWFQFHFDKSPNHLNIHTKVFDIPTIIELIREQAGLAILPKYLTKELEEENKLKTLVMPREMINTIHLARRKGVYEPKIVTLCRSFLIHTLKDTQTV